MSEEDAALFWRVDTPTDPVSGEASADPALGSTETTPAKGLCLRATILPTSVVATSAPAVEGSTAKFVSAETTQDTKPAVRPRATNTVDVAEIQEAETAIQRFCQVTTGTQTEEGDSFQEVETLNLKETKRGCILKHTDRDHVCWTNPAQRHASETKRSEKG